MSLVSADIDELRHLIAAAKSPRIVEALNQLLVSVPTDVTLEGGGMDVDPVPLISGSSNDIEIENPPPVPPSSASQVPTYAQTFTDKAFRTIKTYSFDPGEYNSPTVTVYVPMTGVGGIDKSGVSCDFGATTGFDLIVRGWEGATCRLKKDNLDHDIVPEKCKFIVKKDKIVIKLGKVKNEFSYESWTDLTAKKSKDQRKKDKDDPQASIMNLMKVRF